MAHNDPYEWSMEQHDPAGIGHRVRQSNEINCTVGGSFEISCTPSANCGPIENRTGAAGFRSTGERIVLFGGERSDFVQFSVPPDCRS